MANKRYRKLIVDRSSGKFIESVQGGVKETFFKSQAKDFNQDKAATIVRKLNKPYMGKEIYVVVPYGSEVNHEQAE